MLSIRASIEGLLIFETLHLLRKVVCYRYFFLIFRKLPRNCRFGVGLEYIIDDNNTKTYSKLVNSTSDVFKTNIEIPPFSFRSSPFLDR